MPAVPEMPRLRPASTDGALSADCDPAVLDADIEAAGREGARSVDDPSVGQGQLGAVPGAFDRIADERSFRQRAAEVGTSLGEGKDLVAAPDEEDGHAAGQSAR